MASIGSTTPSSSASSAAASGTSSSPSSLTLSNGTGPVLSASGLGSGLNIQAMVQSLVAATGDPITQRLNTEEAQAQAEISGFGTVSSALSGLQSQIQSLQSLSSFSARTATSSDTTIMSASAAAGTATGNYQVVVNSLASAQELMSNGFADSSTVVGTGTLEISGGANTFSVTVNSSNDTLSGIVNAINSASGNTSVTAGLVTVDNGSGGSVTKLVLSARQPGTSNTITVKTLDGDGNNTDQSGLSQLAYDTSAGGAQNLTQVAAAQDANLTIDGQSVTRSTNTITDAISGVTLNLVKADPTTTVNLGISGNNSVATNAVHNFVDAYNSLTSTLSQLTAYDPTTQQAGTLIGDASINALSARLGNIIGNPVSGQPLGYSSLATLGITTDASGKLVVNDATLSSAVTNNMNAVQQLFNGPNGLSQQLSSVVDAFLGTPGSTGLIASRTNALQTQIQDIGQQRTALAARLQTLQTQYMTQFNAMDTLVAQMNQTSSYLSQQFSALSASTSGSGSSSGG